MAAGAGRGSVRVPSWWRGCRGERGPGGGDLGQPQPGSGPAGGQPDRACRPVIAGEGGSGGGDRGRRDHATPQFGGEAGVQRGFAARRGEPEQHRGGDGGAGGEHPVAGELGHQAGQVLGAGVVFEEELRLGRAGGDSLVPAAVGVGAGQVAPQRGAAPFGPPGHQARAGGAAGAGGQGGEERVGPGGMGEAGGDCDGQGAVAAVAELGGGDGVFGGEHLGAGGAEDEVPGRGPGDDQGPEPVDDLVLVEGEQPGGGGAGGAERELGDLGGGWHAVLPDHARQPAVPAVRRRSASWERGIRWGGHGRWILSLVGGGSEAGLARRRGPPADWLLLGVGHVVAGERRGSPGAGPGWGGGSGTRPAGRAARRMRSARPGAPACSGWVRRSNPAGAVPAATVAQLNVHWGEIVALVLLTGAAAFFAASETALISLSRIHARAVVERGIKQGPTILRLVEQRNKVLTTILVGNTIVLLAAQSLATALFIELEIPQAALWSTVLMTTVMLLFGEIIPKTVAVSDAERWALRLTPLLRRIAFVLNPLASAALAVTSAVVRVLRLAPLSRGPFITEEDIRTLVDVGAEQKVLEEQERDLIHSIIEFGDTIAREVMTPRPDMVCVEVTQPPTRALDLVIAEGYSKLPVFEDTIDNIIGVVHDRELLISLANGTIG